MNAQIVIALVVAVPLLLWAGINAFRWGPFEFFTDPLAFCGLEETLGTILGGPFFVWFGLGFYLYGGKFAAHPADGPAWFQLTGIVTFALMCVVALLIKFVLSRDGGSKAAPVEKPSAPSSPQTRLPPPPKRLR